MDLGGKEKEILKFFVNQFEVFANIFILKYAPIQSTATMY